MRAILIEKDDAGYRAAVKEVDSAGLPEGDVLVDVEFSSLNYKDSLAVTGQAPVVRKFPMIPGIDLAGRVLESACPLFRPGDHVLVNGFGLGETHWGGYADRARVRGEWLLPVPGAFSTAKAMAVGTAGYTAMLSVLALEGGGVTPDRGEVLVTGATGGVGSVAVAILSRLGYRVAAATRRLHEEEAYLRDLGATSVIDSGPFAAMGKPLQKETWAGVIDVAGSHTLANACAQTRPGGVVAACGLAQGMDFPTSVAPFILRGVTLRGIDSVYCPLAQRRIAWERLARDLDQKKLAAMTRFIGLEEVIPAARQQLAGRVRGRVVVRL